MRKFDSRFRADIYICTWKYMVAFCSNRGIVSSRLIVQIFTRIFLSFSLCPISLKVSIVPMCHLSRVKNAIEWNISVNNAFRKGGWNEKFRRFVLCFAWLAFKERITGRIEKRSRKFFFFTIFLLDYTNTLFFRDRENNFEGLNTIEEWYHHGISFLDAVPSPYSPPSLSLPDRPGNGAKRNGVEIARK